MDNEYLNILQNKLIRTSSVAQIPHPYYTRYTFHYNNGATSKHRIINYDNQKTNHQIETIGIPSVWIIILLVSLQGIRYFLTHIKLSSICNALSL